MSHESWSFLILNVLFQLSYRKSHIPKYEPASVDGVSVMPTPLNIYKAVFQMNQHGVKSQITRLYPTPKLCTLSVQSNHSYKPIPA